MAVDNSPVTVLTGFLGAGKTTLLNRLLRDPALTDTAVLVNEFGEVGLDHLLVETLSDEVVLLNAGCLCCTVRGDLSRALRDLAERIDTGQTIRRVVIETTGLADPVPIVQTLASDPSLPERFRLDTIITAVDAVNGAATLDAQPEALKQAALADRIVLTKTDLADAETLATLKARLHQLNPGATQVEAQHHDALTLLNAAPFDPDTKSADVRAWLNAEAWEARDHHHHHHDHHHDPSRHNAEIHSFCLTFSDPLPWQGVSSWLNMLIVTRGADLLRVKGILHLDSEPRPVVIHGVQHLFHPPALLDAWPKDDPRTSRIVFIVRNIPRETIESSLNAFLEASRDITD